LRVEKGSWSRLAASRPVFLSDLHHPYGLLSPLGGVGGSASQHPEQHGPKIRSPDPGPLAVVDGAVWMLNVVMVSG
jgi:hypothetical protein